MFVAWLVENKGDPKKAKKKKGELILRKTSNRDKSDRNLARTEEWTREGNPPDRGPPGGGVQEGLGGFCVDQAVGIKQATLGLHANCAFGRKWTYSQILDHPKIDFTCYLCFWSKVHL